MRNRNERSEQRRERSGRNSSSDTRFNNPSGQYRTRDYDADNNSDYENYMGSDSDLSRSRAFNDDYDVEDSNMQASYDTENDYRSSEDMYGPRSFRSSSRNQGGMSEREDFGQNSRGSRQTYNQGRQGLSQSGQGSQSRYGHGQPGRSAQEGYSSGSFGHGGSTGNAGFPARNQSSFDQQWDSQRGYTQDYYGMKPGQEQSQGQHWGKGPKGYNRSDDRIREDICEALRHDAQIDASEIEVEVNQGVVSLSGTVESRQIRRAAEELIENIAGVSDVQNKLTAKKETESGSQKSQSLSGQKSHSSSERDEGTQYKGKSDTSSKGTKLA